MALIENTDTLREILNTVRNLPTGSSGGSSGGGAYDDTEIRELIRELQEKIGNNVVVENGVIKITAGGNAGGVPVSEDKILMDIVIEEEASVISASIPDDVIDDMAASSEMYMCLMIPAVSDNRTAATLRCGIYQTNWYNYRRYIYSGSLQTAPQKQYYNLYIKRIVNNPFMSDYSIATYSVSGIKSGGSTNPETMIGSVYKEGFDKGRLLLRADLSAGTFPVGTELIITARI